MPQKTGQLYSSLVPFIGRRSHLLLIMRIGVILEHCRANAGQEKSQSIDNELAFCIH